MLNPSQIAVLAAAEGGIVTVIFVVVAIISWIINISKGAQQQQAKRKESSQATQDLEKFIRGLSGQSSPEPEKKRQPKQQKPPKKPQAAKQKPPAQRSPIQRPVERPADRPGTKLAQTHLAPMAGGDSVRSHVASHMEPRNVDAQVRQDVDRTVQRDIAEAVRQDIGVDGTSIVNQREEHPLIQVLRNPQGVRQAIIMAEILNRPKPLR
jgi:hypothetical protein